MKIEKKELLIMFVIVIGAIAIIAGIAGILNKDSDPAFGPEVTISETVTYYKACVTPENPGCVTICTWVDIYGEKAPFEIPTDTPIKPDPGQVQRNMLALLKGDS